MKTLVTFILLILILFFIVREGPKVLSPRRPYEPGWATMRYDGPWYGQRHFVEP